jgi:hypothetical protein
MLKQPDKLEAKPIAFVVSVIILVVGRQNDLSH